MVRVALAVVASTAASASAAVSAAATASATASAILRVSVVVWVLGGRWWGCGCWGRGWCRRSGRSVVRIRPSTTGTALDEQGLVSQEVDL